ncbi:MAG TPA: DegT/DnrJ/EryC1/StrS family aminotransferase, partial [Chitinophagales bacterium]|nr:DegT/DnrJ/EryC1/StrS family aminotransferase [Chitinophagales bacterium]
NESFLPQLNIAYENGTNKADFLAGKVDEYEWKGLGSNCYMSEMLARVLLEQLKGVEKITAARMAKWNYYQQFFTALEKAGDIELLKIPAGCVHNGHNFIIKTPNLHTRAGLMDMLARKGIEAAFHYIALHSSEFGKKAGKFIGEDKYTTRDSQRLLRLPLFHDIGQAEQDRVLKEVYAFFGKKYPA